jgi:hypothetical protein
MRKFLGVALAALTIALPSAALAVPVMVGGDPDVDACPGMGEVVGLDPQGDDFLAVRDGPSTSFKKIDEVYQGDALYLCDKKGNWYGVVYASGPGIDCEVSLPVDEREPYAGECYSGWVYGGYVEVVEAGAASDDEGDDAGDEDEPSTGDDGDEPSTPDIVPVEVGGNDGLDACTSIGEVVGLNPDGDNFLAVREGPSTSYPKVDELHEGDEVYVCDEIDTWLGIVYRGEADDPDLDCEVSGPIDPREPYQGECRSGWVSSKYIEIIAG